LHNPGDKHVTTAEKEAQERLVSVAADLEVSEEDELDCRKPCDPNVGCGVCADYWARMRRQGFWKDGVGWTEAGMREMTK
jgi:hypothetical protein